MRRNSPRSPVARGVWLNRRANFTFTYRLSGGALIIILLDRIGPCVNQSIDLDRVAVEPWRRAGVAMGLTQRP